MTIQTRPLGAYLALAFSLLTVLLTGILVLSIEHVAIEQAKSQIGARLAGLALQTSDKLDRGLFERYREVSLMASQASLLQAADDAQARRTILTQVQKSYRFYDWIGLTRPDGKVLVSGSGMLEGADVSGRPWFREGLNGGYLGDVHEARLLAKLLPGEPGEPRRFVDVAFPLVDAAGRVQGVLGAHMSWRWAADVERSVVGASPEPGLETLILSSRGEVFLGPQTLLRKMLVLDSAKRALIERNGSLVETWPDGKQYLVGYSQSGALEKDYPSLGWITLVRQPVDVAFAPLQQLRDRILVTGMLLALVFSVVGFAAARRITRPLKRLADSAAKMRDGDLLEIDAGPGAYQEITELNGTLNALVANLGARRQQIEELNATLEQRVESRTAELRAARDAANAGEARVRAIIEAAQDAFIGVDMDGRIVDWNSQAERLLGWQQEEAIGHTLSDLMQASDYRPSVASQVTQFLDDGYTGVLERRTEREVTDRHGKRIPVEMTTCLTGQHHNLCFCIFLRDITERRKIEQLKNEFVSTVSHELRTPLTSMRASLELLEEGVLGRLDPEVQELVEICSSNCARLGRLVNDVLDVQKMEAGMMSFVPRVQPVLPLLREACRTMQAMAADERVELVVQVAPGADEVRAAIDYDRLIQVLNNLLSNAIKFSPHRGIVTLRLEARADKVSIAVLDQGPGIPVDERDRVFAPFVQLAGYLGNPERKGTGLGLSISKRIVEQHGGELRVDDAPGGGSLFEVIIGAA